MWKREGMKAGNLLRALTNNPFIEFSGLYTFPGGNIVPITTIKPGHDNTLILFSENRKKLYP